MRFIERIKQLRKIHQMSQQQLSAFWITVIVTDCKIKKGECGVPELMDWRSTAENFLLFDFAGKVTTVVENEHKITDKLGISKQNIQSKNY
jgi:hypothetical protein